MVTHSISSMEPPPQAVQICFPVKIVLAFAGDDTFPHQFDDASGGGFGIPAQVMFVIKGIHAGAPFAGGTYADLEGIAIIDQSADITGNGFLYRSGFNIFAAQQVGAAGGFAGRSMFYEQVDFGNMDMVFTVGPDQVFIDFGDDELGAS